MIKTDNVVEMEFDKRIKYSRRSFVRISARYFTITLESTNMTKAR